MTLETLELVRIALARYLGIHPHLLSPDDDLRSSLGLDAVDLTLIVIGFEDPATGAEFPVAHLDDVRTVAELAAVLGDFLTPRSSAHRERERETIPEEERATLIPDGEPHDTRAARMGSGVHPIDAASARRARVS